MIPFLEIFFFSFPQPGHTVFPFVHADSHLEWNFPGSRILYNFQQGDSPSAGDLLFPFAPVLLSLDPQKDGENLRHQAWMGIHGARVNGPRSGGLELPPTPPERGGHLCPLLVKTLSLPTSSETGEGRLQKKKKKKRKKTFPNASCFESLTCLQGRASPGKQEARTGRVECHVSWAKANLAAQGWFF